MGRPDKELSLRCHEELSVRYRQELLQDAKKELGVRPMMPQK